MRHFIKRSASVSKDDRFLFPATLKKLLVDGRVILLSPETANWLVIEEEELPMLESLIGGETVGSIQASTNTSGEFGLLKNLLAQITARNFASTEGVPPPKIDPCLKGAYFYLTNACNLNCAHCYMFSGKATDNELTVDEWIHLIDDFAECGGTNITFSGGEILAKRGWFRVVEHAYKRHITSTILTNGTLWTSESIQAVAAYVTEVQVSLDGPTEDINSITRGAGSYQKAIDTAKKFAATGTRTSIAMTPTLSTFHLFESEIQRFFESQILGTSINIRISHKLLNGREVNYLTGDDKKRYEETSHRLSELIYTSSKQRSFSLEHQPNQIHLNCGFGGASISSDGNVYPCNRIGDVHSIGNIRVDKFEKIIPLLKRAATLTSVDNISPCKWCDLRYICGGGCRIDDFYISGSNGERLLFKESAIDNDSVGKDSCSEDYRLSLLRQMAGLRDYQFTLNE